MPIEQFLAHMGIIKVYLLQRINKSYMGIIKRSVRNLAMSLTEGEPLFKSKIELCVPKIVLTPSLTTMQVLPLPHETMSPMFFERYQ